jgi:hypothetical protein
MSPYWKFRMTPLMIGLAIAVLRLAGATSDAAAAALPKDPCTLVKPTEIQALASNAKIGSGVLDTSAAPLVVACTYSWGPRTSEWGESALTISVTDATKVWPAGLSPDDIKQRVVLEARTGGPGSSEIAGIGDGAVFSADPKSHNATAKAYVVKGKGLLMMVTFHGGNALSQKDKIIAILKDASARL